LEVDFFACTGVAFLGDSEYAEKPFNLQCGTKEPQAVGKDDKPYICN